MNKRRKKKGLLSHQKPKRRWIVLARFVKPLSILAAIGVCLYLSIYFSQKVQISLSSLQKNDERPQLAVTRSIEPKDEEKIRSAYQKLNQVDRATMSNLAIQVQEGVGLRKIELIQSTPYRIMIASHPFVPKMMVELDSLRFVSDDGIIFGRVNEGDNFSIPTLRGLDRKTILSKNKNGTYITTSGNQRIIEESLLALQIGEVHGVHFKSLYYDDFRGISGELVDPTYRITLGFRPFESKFVKLDKILPNLRERGITSASIELDYKGKAFVKESVL